MLYTYMLIQHTVNSVYSKYTKFTTFRENQNNTTSFYRLNIIFYHTEVDTPRLMTDS